MLPIPCSLSETIPARPASAWVFPLCSVEGGPGGWSLPEVQSRASSLAPALSFSGQTDSILLHLVNRQKIQPSPDLTASSPSFYHISQNILESTLFTLSLYPCSRSVTTYSPSPWFLFFVAVFVIPMVPTLTAQGMFSVFTLLTSYWLSVKWAILSFLGPLPLCLHESTVSGLPSAVRLT